MYIQKQEKDKYNGYFDISELYTIYQRLTSNK